MIRVKADLRALRRYQRKLKVSPQLLKRIGTHVAEELLGLVQEGFRKEANPYGQRWAKKKRDDGRSILVGKTARLRRGWHTESVSRGTITIAPSVSYADFHQTGTSRMVDRKMVPDDQLPKTWERVIEEAASEILRDHFG